MHRIKYLYLTWYYSILKLRLIFTDINKLFEQAKAEQDLPVALINNYFTNKFYFIKNGLSLFRLTLHHKDKFAGLYGYLAFIIMGLLKEDYRYISKVNNGINDFLTNNPDLPNIKIATTIYALNIQPWFYPLKDSTNLLQSVYKQACLHDKQEDFTLNAMLNMLMYDLFRGHYLDEIEKKIEANILLIKNKNKQLFTFILQMIAQFIKVVTVENQSVLTLESAVFTEAELLQELNNFYIKPPKHWYYFLKLWLAILFNYNLDVELLTACTENKELTNPGYCYIEHHFLVALYLLQQSKELKKAKAYCKKIKKWADLCPENNQHKYCLLTAEIARAEGDILLAQDYYYSAIRSAVNNGFLHIAALANELLAKFFVYRGQEIVAQTYFTEARNLYLEWGAQHKAATLEERVLKVKKYDLL